jgi:hypothetical protein
MNCSVISSSKTKYSIYNAVNPHHTRAIKLLIMPRSRSLTADRVCGSLVIHLLIIDEVSLVGCISGVRGIQGFGKCSFKTNLILAETMRNYLRDRNW